MKSTLIASLPGSVLLILSLLTSPAHAAGNSGNWRLDLSGASVSFSVSVLGLFNIGGMFERVAGDILLDDTCTAAAITFSIDATSVNTRNAKDDRFLRSAALLNTENFPRVTFASRNIVLTDSGTGSITGTLSLNGISRDVRFTFQRHTIEHGDTATINTRFEASTRISRSDFGITALPIAVSDTVNLRVSVAALPANIRIAAATP
jgi:polyisoprenoid-binding protein YceI